MILQIFVVRDAKTDSFGNPMFLISVGQAVRSFSDEVNRVGEDNQLNAHPEDFELFSVGSFDTSDACFSVYVPRSVCLASNVIVRK